MDSKIDFENKIINFFQNRKYVKGQFYPYDEALSGVDYDINNFIKQFKGDIVYDKIMVWGQSLIYSFIWKNENSIIEVNITPTGNYGASFIRCALNWKLLDPID
jgi:hypothetical protein